MQHLTPCHHPHLPLGRLGVICKNLHQKHPFLTRYDIKPAAEYFQILFNLSTLQSWHTHWITQRFKPLPSIGSTRQMQSDVVGGADSAVDLTSPSPTTSSTEIRAPSIASRTVTLRSDRKHSHLSDNWSRSSSREGRSSTKAAKIDTKPPIVTNTQATVSDEGRARRTRGSSKAKVKSKPPTSKPNLAIPPEPSKDAPNKLTFGISPEPSKDAPHTVMLKLRLPGDECIQRRFSYQVDRLGCVVSYACSVMNSKGVDTNFSVNNVILSSNCVPMVVYSDLSLTLEQAGLVHNTLLHLDYENS